MIETHKLNNLETGQTDMNTEQSFADRDTRNSFIYKTHVLTNRNQSH